MQFKITPLEANQRIDKMLRRALKEAPLSFIYKIFRQKDVKVNGKKATIDYITREGDVVDVYLKESLLEQFKTTVQYRPVKINLDILYEDENLCIVNKNKGLLVHGSEDEQRNTLQNIFINYMISKNEYDPTSPTAFVPSPVHRLDRNTSGIVILAKNLPTTQLLLELFKEKTSIKKSYILLVKGGRLPSEGEISYPLIKDAASGKVRVGRLENGARPALTRYRVLKKYNGFTLVEAELVTGRTHQIRVHFQTIGNPIIGDRKYGDYHTNTFFEEMYGLKSQFLHAANFEFLEIPGYLDYLSNMKFTAKLPAQLQRILDDIKL